MDPNLKSILSQLLNRVKTFQNRLRDQRKRNKSPSNPKIKKFLIGSKTAHLIKSLRKWMGIYHK
jgi:hypothetical protein